MAQVTAQLVKELREMTGVGMMECKKALVAAEGDLTVAVEELRKAGQAKAVKKSGRTTAEGLISALVSDDKKSAVMVEINCETDFVAREEKFIEFTNRVAEIAKQENISDVETLVSKEYGSGVSVEDTRLNLIAKIGENISVRRIALLSTDSGVIGSYMHAGSRIGALVVLDNGDSELATDLAMQVTAMNPEYISKDEVDPARVAKEKEIFMAQAAEQHANKPKDIVEKIITGQVSKAIEGLTLYGQPFVKDQNVTVEKLVKGKGVNVTEMVRFAVGEGIEKEENDFVKEVMSQVKG